MMKLAILASLSLVSCATLFGDKDRNVLVESEPSGARVFFNGMPYGRTPMTVPISNMLATNLVTVKLEGYDEVTRPISASVQPVAFLNLLNLICWGIDFATGNVMKLDTKMISISLDKRTSALQSQKENLLSAAAATPAFCVKI